MENSYFLAISVITFVFVVLIGFFVSRKRIHSHMHLLFFFFCVALSLNVLCTYLSLINHSDVVTLMFIRTVMALAVIQSTVLLLFGRLYPEKRLKPDLKVGVIVLLSIVTIIVSFSNLLFSGITYENGYPIPRIGPGVALFTVTAIGYLTYTLITLLVKIFRLQGVNVIRLLYVFVGVAIMYSGILYFSFIRVIVFNDSSGVFLTPFFTIPFIILTAVALTRYRFMDVRVVVNKGLIYITSLALALGIYTIIVLSIKNIIEESWNTSVGWTAAVLILITVVGFIPVKKGVEYLINKLFKGRKSIDLAVAELKKDISEQSGAAALAKLITAQTRRFLDVGEAHLYLGKPGEELVSDGNGSDRIARDNDVVRYFQKYREPIVREEIGHMIDEREGEFERDALRKVEKEMKKQKVSIAMPFVHEDGLYGLLTIGVRENREAYTVQDIQFLSKLREEIGFTLASALQYSYAMERIKQMEERGQL